MSLKKWILQSIPLQNLLKEWCITRELLFIEENQFSQEIKNLFYQNKIGVFEANYLLTDFKNFHIGLFAKEEYLPENLLQDYIEELEEFLKNCGRNQNDFKILKIKLYYDLEIKNKKIFPLFFIIWIPEKPLLENLLSGKYKDNNDNNLGEFKSNIIQNAKENFYLEENKNLIFYGKYNIKKIEFNKNQYIYKYFVKKFNDKYVLLILSLKSKEFKLDYLKNLIEFFVYSERPVLKLEENLRYNKLKDKSIILLELKFNGLWKGIFYNTTALFYRKNKNRIYLLPNYYYHNKYIKLSFFYNEDELIILPSYNNDMSFIKKVHFEDLYKELMNLKPGKAISLKFFDKEM